MRNIVKPALALAALALAAATSAAPAAVAAEARPAGTASIASVGNGTNLKSGLDFAWIHLQPSYNTEHLVVNRGDNLSAVCATYAGGEWWNLIFDSNKTFAGYTLASYLTAPTRTDCNNIGVRGTVTGETWVHMYPHADWAYLVANNGDAVAPICYVGNTDTDGQWHLFDLVVDRSNQVAGFAVDFAVTAPTPSYAC
ncbi:hypothetical protein ACIBCA_01925 [Kitasatospora sp. NPDC051170]|uniref:hypothetical protein n=1 Tax=Kitasatospora sp. NPDC051170 TaxID=3364056 RepID=UPI00379D7FDB